MAERPTNRTAVIFASRPLAAGMRRYVPPGAFIVAADAGWKNAGALGLRVDLAVGDFDSAPPPADAGELLRLPAQKDDTDTHYAAKELLRRGYGDIVLLGGLGGRADHTFANWQTLLHLARAGARCLAADAGVELRCMGPGSLALAAGGWRWLSVFAAGDTARGVWLEGLKYPLCDAVLTPDVPLGVSNEFLEEQAVVRCGEGHLYVLLSTEDGEADGDG